MLLLWYTPPPAAFSVYLPEKKPGEAYTLVEEEEIIMLAYYFGWIE